MVEEKICPDCKIRPLKYVNRRYTNRCIPCTMINDGKTRNEYHKKVKKVVVDRECVKCEKKYKPIHAKQKFCHNPCTRNKTNIEMFLEHDKKPIKKKVFVPPPRIGFAKKEFE